MPQLNDQSRSHTVLKPDSTLIAVLEMSQSAWLVAGLLPGIERHPLKKIEPDEATLLRLLRRWQEEATKAGHPITRITLAFEAGRDGFWLARWLRAHGIEAHVIHPTSVAVSREHRRAKSDRLDTALLKRAFLGWLRGEQGHCSMAEIPTLEEEDAKRPTREREGLVRERTRLVNRIKGALARLGIRGFKPTLRHAPERLSALRLPEGAPLPPNTLAELRRDMARLRFVLDQIREIEAARLEQLQQHPETGTHTMVRVLAQVVGVGIVADTRYVRVPKKQLLQLRQGLPSARRIRVTWPGVGDCSGPAAGSVPRKRRRPDRRSPCRGGACCRRERRSCAPSR